MSEVLHRRWNITLPFERDHHVLLSYERMARYFVPVRRDHTRTDRRSEQKNEFPSLTMHGRGDSLT